MWTILIGSLSVLLGWLLYEISQLFISRRENRKVRKKVLFELLETHYVLKKMDVWDVTQYLISKIEEKVGEKIPEEYIQDVQTMIQCGLIDQMEQTVWEELDEIDKTYQSAIHELSTVDPIRAYRLRYKTRLIDQTDSLRQNLLDVQSHIENKEDFTELETAANPLILKKFKNEVEDLREEISSLAGTISRGTRKEIDYVLQADKLDDNEEADQFIDVFIKKMLNGHVQID